MSRTTHRSKPHRSQENSSEPQSAKLRVVPPAEPASHALSRENFDWHVQDAVAELGKAAGALLLVQRVVEMCGEAKPDDWTKVTEPLKEIAAILDLLRDGHEPAKGGAA